MKEQYDKPEFSELGKVVDVTAASGSPVFVDVPFGTVPQPGQQIIGSH